MTKPVSEFIIDTDEDFLKKSFQTIDKNNDGFLCHDEIDTFFNEVGMPVKLDELNNFKAKIDDPSRGELAGKCVYQVRFKATVRIHLNKVKILE